MARVLGKEKLVVVPLCGEDARHVFVGKNPVVKVVSHDVGIEGVAVANLEPQPERLVW